MSSANSPCAACKCLRRKCTPECVFAPYFPPEKPEKFACVHKVFGASNVSKILNELSPIHREEAVTSLAYEAQTRIEDPVYGCVAWISILQQRVKQVHEELRRANRELSQYMQLQPTTIGDYPFAHYNNASIHSGGQLVMHEPQPQPQQAFEAQEMLRIAYEQHHQQQQQQQQQFSNQMMISNGVGVSDSGMGNILENGNNYQVHEHLRNTHLQTEDQLLVQGQRSGSEEGPSIGPS